MKMCEEAVKNHRIQETSEEKQKTHNKMSPPPKKKTSTCKDYI